MIPKTSGKILLFIVSVSFFIPAVAQPSKNYQGLLWEISRPGAAKKSYLYGTMHVSRKISFNLSDTFYYAIQQCDAIGVESTPDEWLDKTLNPVYANFYYGMYPAYNENNRYFYQKSFELVPPDNRLIAQELSGDNYMINSLQYRNSDDIDYEEDTYLDMFIFQAGLKQDKKVLSLEDFKRSTELYYKAVLSYRKNRDKDEKKPPQWLQDMLKEKSYYDLLEDAYRTGNLDLIDEMNTHTYPDEYNKFFLHDRNDMMAVSIDSVIRLGNSIFSAVGAAHLPGKNGVIEMLRKKGYVVRSVAFTQTEYAKSNKEKLDKKTKPLQLTWQTAPDGTFGLQLPNNLYQLYSSKSVKKYISPDYTNGSFFIASKINTFNFIDDYNTAKYEAKVDSLLFENIPGDIKEKKVIYNNGIKGLEIRNVTKAGNHQRYQIFYTPLEIMIFKMGGRKEFVEQWGDSIFNSLQLSPIKDQWADHQYYNKEFTVALPGQVVFDNNNTLASLFQLPLVQAYNPAKKEYYFVKKAVLNDLEYLEEDNFELKHIAERFIKRHNFKEVSSKLFLYKGYPAIEFSCKRGKEQLQGRIIIRENNYYFLGTTATDKTNAQRFFTSLSFQPATYAHPFSTFNDTSAHFSVSTDTAVNFLNNYAIQSDFYYGNNDYLKYTFKDVSFISPNQEVVMVLHKQFRDYEYYPNEDSVFNQVVLAAKGFEEFIITDRKTSIQNGFRTVEATVRDTGTMRNIRLKMMLPANNNKLFLLVALADSITPPGAFVTTFFNTFKPTDTIKGKSVFEDKAPLLLKDLTSSDTSKRRKAIEGLSWVDFSEKDADTVIHFVEHYPFQKDENYLKYDLLEKLMAVKSDHVLEYGKTLYKNNEQNFPFQRLGLNLASSQDNVKSVQFLKETLINDLPLLNAGSYDEEGYGYYYPMYYFDDTLALLKQFYPEILKLLYVSEYKDMLIEEIAYLLDSNYVTTKDYEAYLDQLKTEAKLLLKKEIAEVQVEKLNTEREKASTKETFYESSGYSNIYIQRLLTLLLPFHERADIKPILQMADSMNSYPNLISYYTKKLKRGLPVDKHKIEEIASKYEYVIDLYEALDKIGKTSIIPEKYLKEDHLLYASVLNGNYEMRQLDFRENKPKLLKKEKMDGKNHRIEVYYLLYDRTTEKKKKETAEEDEYDADKNADKYMLICVAYLDDDKEKRPVTVYELEHEDFDNMEKLQETMDKLTDRIKYKHRNRVGEEIPLRGNKYSLYDSEY